MKKKTAVVVTTENRGVFFGYVDDDSNAPSKIVIKNARMCVYWSQDVKGVVGLAATGPTKSCRVTHSTPTLTAYKVTAILECTNAAADAWEKALWS